MSPILASAPGKLLLTGEYAVLAGAPALVAAVDRRVRVRVGRGTDGQGRLTARPLGLSAAATAVVDGALACPGRPDVELGVTGRFVVRAMVALGRSPCEAAGLVLEIDSRELFDGRDGRPVKLGLGSSAAVCAALAVALEQLFAPSDAAGRLQRWLSPYRDALAGRASGADLAASLHGGLIVFADALDAPSATGLDWPEGLYWQPVWTGTAASSPDFVARFRDWQQREPDASAARIRELAELARDAVARADSAAGLIDAAARYARGIRALAAAMDCEIETEAHRRLAGLAGRFGLVYKTCGAGGGDLGVALDRDPERLAAFATESMSLGAVPVNFAIAADGARATPSAKPGTGG